jgi:hypothetical protein
MLPFADYNTLCQTKYWSKSTAEIGLGPPQKTRAQKAKERACLIVVGGTGIEPVTPAV